MDDLLSYQGILKKWQQKPELLATRLPPSEA